MLAKTQVKILVPGHHDMVRLVGARDELLKLIEAAFDTAILVRTQEGEYCAFGLCDAF